ncbi:hypothetical protein [uncultured Methanobrevibacter sp.]|uniref:hypothetical protein n=1 Tax=uncultured Methanobrevibacter sp. TaxID=253161 RepID=UPI0025F7CBA7|nr:hypothetical protein [uncultured Methanobrevibacter sp.]
MIDYNTSKDFIVVTFIKMKDLSSLKKVIANLPRGIESISYLEFYNKLIKKEDRAEPSEMLISSYIIKKINLLLLENSTTHICYILDICENVILEKLENIMQFIINTSKKPIKFEIISDEEEILKQTEKLNIKRINYEIL